MINAINSITKVKQIKIKPYGEKANITATKQQEDTFEKTIPSFKGSSIRKLKQRFTSEEIFYAKKNLSKDLGNLKEEVYKQVYAHLKATRPDWEGESRGHQKFRVDMNNPYERTLLGIMTFGLSEVAVQIENAGFRKDARSKADDITIIRAELESIRLNECIAETTKEVAKNENEIKFKAMIDKVINEDIKPKLIYPIQRFLEGKEDVIPNCIMISHKDPDVNNILVNSIEDLVNADYKTIDISQLSTKLDEAEENYQKTRNWNVLRVNNLEDRINPEKSLNKVISSMKNIMTSTAEDYHSTLLFTTLQPEKLDEIALQPHRVTKINVQDIKTIKEMNREDAIKRLEDENYSINMPISALNDLLLINNSDVRIGWDYNEKDYNNVKENKFYIQIYIN